MTERKLKFLCFTKYIASVSVILLLPKLYFAAADSSIVGNGLGDRYEWRTLSDGLEVASGYKKPLMLIIHKSWCGACKALKPKFASSSEIEALSKHFVMVNVQDDEEPSEGKYSPDGGYVPRILFLDPKGEVRTDIYNEKGNPSYKYFYFDTDDIVTSMKKVLGSTLQQEKFGQEL